MWEEEEEEEGGGSGGALALRAQVVASDRRLEGSQLLHRIASFAFVGPIVPTKAVGPPTVGW
jgi:hypothetical protein